jgi:hypothetical protein
MKRVSPPARRLLLQDGNADMTQHDTAKAVADGAAVLTTVGVMATWLPPLASLFTIIYLGLRIWESDTVRELTKRKKASNAIDE